MKIKDLIFTEIIKSNYSFQRKDLIFTEIIKSNYSFQRAVGISRNFSIEKNEKTGKFLCDYSCFDTFQDAVNYCNKMNYETYLMKIKEVEEMKSKWEVK